MHSFDPKDAIFLLNKWDSMKRSERKSEVFKKLKGKLGDTWKDVEENYILKFAATEVNNRFENVLVPWDVYKLMIDV